MENITSRRNPVCVHVKKLGTSAAYRAEHKQFVCDGMKMLEEAVKSGAGIITVITASSLPFSLPPETEIYHAAQEMLDYLSPLKSARDILFICKIPEAETCDISDGIHILLDNIQDPGNTGTIIRSASGFGMDSVILAGLCCDPYNPKTIRATAGAIFRQRIIKISIPELEVLKNKGVSFTGTGLSGSGSPVTEELPENTVIAIGNEGTGLSDEILALCSRTVEIPMEQGCESLNAAVAASIIMWEYKRKG